MSLQDGCLQRRWPIVEPCRIRRVNLALLNPQSQWSVVWDRRVDVLAKHEWNSCEVDSVWNPLEMQTHCHWRRFHLR